MIELFLCDARRRVLPSNKKIVNGGGNFARYAVAESAAYLAYVSIYDASKVQNLPARTIFKKIKTLI